MTTTETPRFTEKTIKHARTLVPGHTNAAAAVADMDLTDLIELKRALAYLTVLADHRMEHLSRDVSATPEERVIAYTTREFITKGYSGHGLIYDGERLDLENTGLTREEYQTAVKNLIADGKLIERGSQDVTYVLPAIVREQLIEDFNLVFQWEVDAPYFYPNDHQHGAVARVRRDAAAERAAQA